MIVCKGNGNKSLLIIWNLMYGKKFICNKMSWNGNQIYLSNWIQVESIRV
jgi:hypothetical protein